MAGEDWKAIGVTQELIENARARPLDESLREFDRSELAELAPAAG